MPPAPMTPVGENATVQVVCLCAAWCGVCREFEPGFRALAAAHPEARFHWVDVEDDAEWVDELDVENFPTLLVGVNAEPVFMGTVLPHTNTVERLLQQAPEMKALRGHEHAATLQALLRHLQTAARN